MPTEYDNIRIIGRTHETSNSKVDIFMNTYYHKRETAIVSELLSRMKFMNKESVIDLGCSIGTWYDDFKRFGFKKIIGIDISEERASKAKKRGYDEIHICNGYELPFDDESQKCVISNDVFVHVLQDSDKLKILQEIHRVLMKDGIFIFNFANPIGFGYNDDFTLDYCRFNKLETITNLINQTKFKIEYRMPSYYAIPRIGSNTNFVNISSKIIFPFIDKILIKFNKLSLAKVIYFGLRK